jgi:outer membrane protein assembly factor BamB
MTTYERDRLIKLAISPAPAVLATPQQRPAFRVGRVNWTPSVSPAIALLLLAALLLVAGLVVVLSRPPALPLELSTYHGGPDHTGIMPGPGPNGDPVKMWEASRNGAISFTIMPAVAHGRVFIADDSGTLAALDEATGGELWTADVGSPIRSSPLLAADLVIVGSDGGAVDAFRATSGRPVWHVQAAGAVSASLVGVEGVVYAGSEDGTLHALDSTTGIEKWAVPVAGAVTRGPAVSHGVIYIGADGGQFAAIDALTHENRWTVELGPGGIGTPTVVGDVIYVGRHLKAKSGPYDLVALSARDGAIVWNFVTPSGIQAHAGAVANGFVYAVCEDNNVYALDPATGVLRWTLATEGSIGTLAGLVGHVLYVTSADETVRAVDATSGRELWKFAVQGTPTMPAVIDGRVIVGTSLGKVVAIGGSKGP